MNEVVIAAAAVIFLGAMIFLVKKLALTIGGTETAAEIVSSRERKKGEYVHTVRFTLDGEEIIAEDKTGYSQPIPPGETRRIKVSRKNSEIFEYADTLQLHIIALSALAVMSVLVMIRFAFFVTE